MVDTEIAAMRHTDAGSMSHVRMKGNATRLACLSASRDAGHFWHFVEGRPATFYIIYSRTYWGEYCCWSPLPHFFGRCRGCSCTSPPGPQVSSTETSGCCIRAAYMQTFAAVEKKQTSTSTLGASISTQVSSSFTSAAVISTSRARDETDPHNTKQGQKQANKQANKQAIKQTNKQTNKQTR